LKIRLPRDLRDRLEITATMARRTLNAEIVTRLGHTFTLEGVGQLNKVAKTFLDLAIATVAPLGDEPTPQELERRELYEARVATMLDPATTATITDEGRLIRWMKLNAQELTERGRVQEAERVSRLARLMEVALSVDVPKSETPIQQRARGGIEQ
jgi:hypothetical protein